VHTQKFIAGQVLVCWNLELKIFDVNDVSLKG